jgi:hypothetical protein
MLHGRPGAIRRFFVAFSRVFENEVLEAIEHSIAEDHLDEDWREWEGDGEVAIGIRLDADVSAPALYTYLPMDVDEEAPFAGHLHASFFTKLDRRHLDPSIPLNRLYFAQAPRLAAHLAVALADSVGDEVAHLPEATLRHLLPDLVAWHPVNDRSGRVLVDAPTDIARTVTATGVDIDDLRWLPIVQRGAVAWSNVRDAWIWDGEGGMMFSLPPWPRSPASISSIRTSVQRALNAYGIL